MKKRLVVVALVGFITGLVAGCGKAQKTDAPALKDTTIVLDTVTAAVADSTQKDSTAKK